MTSKGRINLIAKSALTERQKEYLVLAAFGFSNTKIADILCVEECTVRKSLEAIFDRIGAVDRGSMINLAWILDILDLHIENQIAQKYNIVVPIEYTDRYNFEFNNFTGF